MSYEASSAGKLTPEQVKGIEDFNVGGPEYTVRDLILITDEEAATWLATPADQEISIHLTRGDIDRLYFSITQMNAASTMISETIRFNSYGDIAGASASHRKAAELIKSADGNFRYFFRALITRASPNG